MEVGPAFEKKQKKEVWPPAAPQVRNTYIKDWKWRLGEEDMIVYSWCIFRTPYTNSFENMLDAWSNLSDKILSSNLCYSYFIQNVSGQSKKWKIYIFLCLLNWIWAPPNASNISLSNFSFRFFITNIKKLHQLLNE